MGKSLESPKTPLLDTALTRALGIELPLVCGAMYPCSNPELVGAVSRAGGIGVIQPLTLTYVHGLDFRAGVRRVRTLAGDRPLGMNALIEQSSRVYRERMARWVDVALEEGVRFFVTSLGNPRWVVDAVAPAGGVVYHDVTERKWALKARDGGVHGLIGVNERAGGHAGARTARALLEELADLGLPVLCAGGIGAAPDFVAALRMGYAGVQMGTRFIATEECAAPATYKRAIVAATGQDIVLTERVTGVPLAVIRTPLVERVGTTVGPWGHFLLRGRRTKRWARAWYAVRSAWHFKRSHVRGDTTRDYWQAGKSVDGVTAVETVGAIVERFRAAALDEGER